jgi:hypothetical protein
VSTIAETYTVTFTGNGENFVLAWLAANIPNTTASLGTAGEVILTHTQGGDIILSDIVSSTGVSNGLIAQLGFTIGTNAIPQLTNYQTSTATSTTNGSGDGAVVSITNRGGYYTFNLISGGTSYSVGNTLTFTGGQLGGVTGVHDLVLTVQTVDGSNHITSLAYLSGTPKAMYATRLSNFMELYYTASTGAPATAPADGTQWFYSTATQVDIMVNKNGVWRGYGNVAFDSNGHPASYGTTGVTNPTGVITSTTAPTTQVDASPLVPGDLWLDTSDLENYPVLSRWQAVNGTQQWVLLDNTDQTSHNGVLFADARWGKDGSVDPVGGALPTIAGIGTLWDSDYLDLDAPNPALYPQGMLLFNTLLLQTLQMLMYMTTTLLQLMETYQDTHTHGYQRVV